MGIIIGYLINIITFPGIIIDAFINKTTCEKLDLQVESVNYFALDSEPVVHEIPQTYEKMFVLAIVPFLIQTSIAVVLFQIGVAIGEPAEYFFGWLGVSIAAHAFPSVLMGGLLWEHSKLALKQKKYYVILGMPLVLLIFIARVLHMFWLDIIYGVLLYLWIKGENIF